MSRPNAMYGSNALPLPSPFAREHRPLPMPSESPRPFPTGECRFNLPTLHSSSQNQGCACQSFHLNRRATGNICECGHQACYHVPDSATDKPPSADTINTVLDKLNTLTDKYKRMEETIQNERGSRETALQRERQMWEREVRILREALAPFYSREKDMRRRLTEIEDKLEGNYDEHVRLRDRVIVIDDATMAMDKRVEELEGSRSKRRRTARTHVLDEPNHHTQASSDTSSHRVPSSVDERSVHTPSSRALSPNGVSTITPEFDEPRSSGILNLVELPRTNTFHLAQHIPPTHDEPRSSGFLTLDLASCTAQKLSDRARQVVRHTALTPPQDRPSPPGFVGPDPGLVRPTHTPPEMEPVGKTPALGVLVLPVNGSPRKRKHQFEHMALDMLADVSVASPLIH